MKSLTITHDGRDYDLAVTWKASLLISQKVCDPVVIFQEAFRLEEFSKQGIPYTPRFEFNMVNSVKILAIAMSANGYDLTEEQVGEMSLEIGPFEFVNFASEFVAMIVNSGPEKKQPAAKKRKPRTGRKS